MKRGRSHKAQSCIASAQGNMQLLCCALLLFLKVDVNCNVIGAKICPPSEIILPCRCSLSNEEVQIWCSHSNLPQIMEAIKAVENNIKGPIDELVLENNQLPALPGRFFGSLEIVRLMLRYNNIERVSNGWLSDLESALLEIYVVEPQLRSIPLESLNGMINVVAITIESVKLKHLPNFSGLINLSYLRVHSTSIIEIQPNLFRHLPKVQNLHINGGVNLKHLDTGLLDSLISLRNIDFGENGIEWIHLRALNHLMSLVSLKLSHNRISDVGMIGRVVKNMENLKKLRLDHNVICTIKEGSFADIPFLEEIHLNDNCITDIEYGAFLRAPMLKTVYLQNNQIRRIHPESFLQSSGGGIEKVYVYNNKIEQVEELRSLFESLPALKFLDISSNYLTAITFGIIRGHGTIEQLYMNNNMMHTIERDALIAMPALRELRIRNNSLSQALSMPFWNLPALKGLDLSINKFSVVSSSLLTGLPSLRRLDLSQNYLSKIDPSAFQHNQMLETLNISFNQLSTIHPLTLRTLDHLFEVDASFNKLAEITPNLPKSVERISMRGNMLKALSTSEKKSLHLPNLRMLDLSLNQLDHISKYSFKNVPHLHVISLANNRLSSLDDTIFIGVQRLELLHLQDNEITQIDERTFLPIPKLRNLNLQGNKLEMITNGLFSNNTFLEQLDLSRNLIRVIAPSAFDSQRSLEYLDLSENSLADISTSLSNLKNLRNIDLSYNKISRVHDEVVSSWKNVVEILLSNNLIAKIKHKTFHNMPRLQYLDLSSNEITTVEPGAFNYLPALQELALADNKLIEVKDHVFENLPNLLASHFQFNMLRYISPNSFHNSPSMLFLNLSNNDFRIMDTMGLRNMRSLEVLDLSSNNLRTVPTMPLKALNWLVELKMDSNSICKIEGSPFEAMPRLRLLSLRNNHLKFIKEKTFRKLRGNIAIFDVEGNPIECSCEMRWLSVWLHEAKFTYPGPKCKDGSLLRSFRMGMNLCMRNQENDERATNSGSIESDKNVNQEPLLNEHGDIFHREFQKELGEECDSYDVFSGERPLAGESDYFYDHYVDYSPENNTSPLGDLTPESLDSNNIAFNAYKKPLDNQSPRLNNTVLNTNFFRQGPPHIPTSPFTFFGYPLPKLGISRFFGIRQRERKHRGELISSMPSIRPSYELSQTHRNDKRTTSGTTGWQRAKVRMYQPGYVEFEKYLTTKNSEDLAKETHMSTVEANNQYHNGSARSHFSTDLNSSETSTFNYADVKGQFETAFKEPTSVQLGGFRPIISDQNFGGFKPMLDPIYPKPDSSVSLKTLPTVYPIDNAVDNASMPNAIKLPQGNFIPVEMFVKALKPTKPAPQQGQIQIKENSSETSSEIPLVSKAYSSRASLSSTSALMLPHISTNTQQSTVTETTNLFSSGTESYPGFTTQSVSISKSPSPLSTTIPETILLIPPPEENVPQTTRHSWIKPKTHWNKQQQEADSSHISPLKLTQQSETSSNVVSARSTISKVTTQQSLNQFLPTAEQYYHRPTSLHSIGNNEMAPSLVSSGSRTQIDNERRKKSNPKAVNRIYQNDGMDWYYESFKELRQSVFPNNKDIHLQDSDLYQGIDYSRYSAACCKQTYGVVYICVSLCFYICSQ